MYRQQYPFWVESRQSKHGVLMPSNIYGEPHLTFADWRGREKRKMSSCRF